VCESAGGLDGRGGGKSEPVKRSKRCPGCVFTKPSPPRFNFDMIGRAVMAMRVDTSGYSPNVKGFVLIRVFDGSGQVILDFHLAIAHRPSPTLAVRRGQTRWSCIGHMKSEEGWNGLEPSLARADHE